MNGFIKARGGFGRLARQAVLSLAALSPLAAGVGCYGYRDIVDPCYPERYEYMARKEVVGAFAPQVHNGRILDQTVWNYHFEAGTDKLTAGGLDHLAYLARRRPAPDTLVFLQTAQDVVYDPEAPDRMTQARLELDQKRAQAVTNFLGAQAAGRGHDFRVVVHDPAEVGLGATGVNNAILQMYGRFRGGLPTGGSGTSGGSGTGNQ